MLIETETVRAQNEKGSFDSPKTTDRKLVEQTVQLKTWVTVHGQGRMTQKIEPRSIEKLFQVGIELLLIKGLSTFSRLDFRIATHE